MEYFLQKINYRAGKNFLPQPVSSIDKTIIITLRPGQSEVKRHFPPVIYLVVNSPLPHPDQKLPILGSSLQQADQLPGIP